MLWFPWERIFNYWAAHWRGESQLTYASYWLIGVDSRLTTFVGASASTLYHLWFWKCCFYWVFLWYFWNMRVLSVSLHVEIHFISCDTAIKIMSSSMRLPRKPLKVERAQKSRLFLLAGILWAERNFTILVFLNCPWAFELIINNNLLSIVLYVELRSNLMF